MGTRKYKAEKRAGPGPQPDALERWLLESNAPEVVGSNRAIPGFFRLFQCNGDEDALTRAYEGRRRLGGW